MKTIADIAMAAGVSKSTVSRVLNNRPGVNPIARQKIQAIIDESHFTANISAKNLKARHSDTVGIMVPLMTSKSVASFIHGMTTELESQRIQILLMNTGMDTDKAINSVKMLNSKGVDGMIALVAGYNQPLINTFRESECPVVAVGQDLSLFNVPSVFYDDYRCGYMAGQQLVECGCKQLLFVGISPMDVALGRQRRRGFEDAISIAGVDCRYIENCDLFVESGREKTAEILAQGYCPDGVFGVTDRIAAGASQALRQAGIIPGEDVALIGVGDDELCSVLTPPLATVHYDHEQVGQQAAQVLMDLVRSKDGETPTSYAYIHQGHFTWRESCQLKNTMPSV
ncbi:LacI family DNA-binding transcriptional regulator [Celerinatantimonas sp. YJH-8]|uniref:LacI family DNA-binding transcriptional regulator n=1 Tax=Celerinatantimonas sp. YJH-8 TaxID=3228714 RepID=UPI0038BFF6FA